MKKALKNTQTRIIENIKTIKPLLTESGQSKHLLTSNFLDKNDPAQQFRGVCFDSQLHRFNAVMTQAMRAILQHLYQPLKNVSKICIALKTYLKKKKKCILLHKMILHMQEWGGSSLYPIFELQRIQILQPIQKFPYDKLLCSMH